MDKSADLRKWFKEDWRDISRKNPDGSHPECGRDDADKGSYPKCRPARAAARMTKKQKTYAVRAKRSKPQGVGGKPTMVATFKKKAMLSSEVNNILEALEKSAKEKQLELFPGVDKIPATKDGTSAKKSMMSRAGKMINDHPGRTALAAGAGAAALYALKKHRDKKKREAAEQAGMYKAAFKNPEVYDILDELEKEAFFKAIRRATKGTLAGAGGRRGYRRVVAAQKATDATRAATAAAAKASREARSAGRGAALPRRYGPFQPGSSQGFAPVRTRRRMQMEARASRTARNRPDAAAARQVSGGRSAARPSTPQPSSGQGTQGTFSFASPAAPQSTAPKTQLQKGLGAAKSLGKDVMNYAKANPLKTAGGVALAAGAANAMRTPKTNPQTGQPQTTRAGQALRGAAVGGALAYGGSKLLKKVASSNPSFDPMNSDLRKMASAETAYILDSLEKEAGKKTKAAVLAAGAGAGAKAAGPAARGLRSAADAGVAKTKAAMTEDNIRSVARGARKAMFEGTDKLRAAAKATGDRDVASGVTSLTRAGNLEGVNRIGDLADKATQHSGAIVDKAQTLGSTAKELADHITPGSGALAGAGVAGAALAANKLRKMRKNRKLRQDVKRGEKARAKLEKRRAN